MYTYIYIADQCSYYQRLCRILCVKIILYRFCKNLYRIFQDIKKYLSLRRNFYHQRLSPTFYLTIFYKYLKKN